MKNRIAIWIHGGIGGGFFSQGQPAIQKLVNRLSDEFEIDVYSQVSPNADFHPDKFSIRSPGRWIKGSWIRWAWLMIVFAYRNFKKPYNVLYAFWGYPPGLIITVLGIVFRKPTLIHLQGGDSVSLPVLRYGVFYNSFRAALCRWAYMRCSSLIALTEYQVSFLRKYDIDREIRVVPFGVDTNQFSFAGKLPGKELHFVHVGNLTPIKDQITMLKTVSLVNKKIPSTLVIVGADFHDRELAKWTASLGIEERVTFKGPVEQGALPSVYQQADILLHTSLYEGQALVFTEAAASGVLLAGTQVGVLADMGDACGIVVPVGDAEALAKKILEIVQTPDELMRKKIKALEWVKSKDENYTVKEITHTLNTLIQNPKAKNN